MVSTHLSVTLIEIGAETYIAINQGRNQTLFRLGEHYCLGAISK